MWNTAAVERVSVCGLDIARGGLDTSLTVEASYPRLSRLVTPDYRGYLPHTHEASYRRLSRLFTPARADTSRYRAV